MSDFDRFLMDIGRKHKSEEHKLTFNQYFELAVKQPDVAQFSVQRVYNMILSHGFSERDDGSTEYNFFKNKIFGARKQIEDIMLYLKAASMGLDIKRRVLLLLGPPGGGKSQILSLIKKGLAAYTKTQKGSIYAIDGCPINEEPLHLIPESSRSELYERHKIKIEGKLCPVCQFKFENDWHRNLNNVAVKKIYVSEENRVGIGTFAPAEKNDMEEFYGSADLSKIEYYGSQSDVRAYSFSGELHTANRGLMEFIEVLKAKPDFLHILLTLAEEQQFKSPRFPLQYVDEMLIAHTNEGEFLRFIGNKENEAVIDRFFIVRMPYNMDAENEEMIYHAALKSKLYAGNIDVHPGALRAASEFAVRTRENEDPLRAGMSGISPRFILNTLAVSLVKINKPKISPEEFLQILAEQIYNYPVLSYETRELYLSYLKEIGEQLDAYDSMKNHKVKIHKDQSSMFDNFVLGGD